MPPAVGSVPALELRAASLGYGDRVLWSGLNLTVEPGEFLAVLGANGSGKTSLLRSILGLQPLSGGTLTVNGEPARRGSRHIGYIPQQRRIDPLTPLRARDIVGLGIDGHRWGIGRPSKVRRLQLDAALAAVGASAYADLPVGVLSGGEQQRVRIAQALATDPRLLLCDEPLLSLDMSHQQVITSLVDRRRRTHDTAIVFVTHEINPILTFVDRVLYLAGGRFSVGTVEEVMTAETLSSLYGARVEVIRSGGRIIVAGVPDTDQSEHHHVDEALAP
ncbi:MAG: metal ABC transporter ATP-binding protein [Jatrophihabitantaceae bacterium]